MPSPTILDEGHHVFGLFVRPVFVHFPLTLILRDAISMYTHFNETWHKCRDRPKFGFGFGYGTETGNILGTVTAVTVKHGFGLLVVSAETATRFRREPKLSPLLAIC